MSIIGDGSPSSRLQLAHLPTPLEAADRLRDVWGGPRVWIKRDDLTGFGLSGNKVRKHEFHLAAAFEAGATVLITCGAAQSNHCRAAALAAARVGLRSVLLLRTSDGLPPAEAVGNHFLQRLAGAEVRFINPSQFDARTALMAEVAADLKADGEVPWVMPAGASDRLGVAAFEHAMHELAAQADTQIGNVGHPVTVWHASSSAGTTAGLAVGARAFPSRYAIVGSSVGEDRAYLTAQVNGLLDDVGAQGSPFEIVDDYVGLGYGRTTDDELSVQVEATRITGLIWDPTYTGKALYGLRQEIALGRFGDDENVVFWHTGGGFAAFAHDFGAHL